MSGGLVRTPLPPWGCAPLVPGTAPLIHAQGLMLTAGFSPGLSRRLAETTVVYPADVVLFEGILVFYSQEIRDMFHLRLFVDTDSDVRLSRRGKADAGPSAPGQAGPRPPRRVQAPALSYHCSDCFNSSMRPSNHEASQKQMETEASSLHGQ